MGWFEVVPQGGPFGVSKVEEAEIYFLGGEHVGVDSQRLRSKAELAIEPLEPPDDEAIHVGERLRFGEFDVIQPVQQTFECDACLRSREARAGTEVFAAYGPQSSLENPRVSL